MYGYSAWVYDYGARVSGAWVYGAWMYVGDLGDIPRRQVLVEGGRTTEHIVHAGDLGDIPRRQVSICVCMYACCMYASMYVCVGVGVCACARLKNIQ